MHRGADSGVSAEPRPSSACAPHSLLQKPYLLFSRRSSCWERHPRTTTTTPPRGSSCSVPPKCELGKGAFFPPLFWGESPSTGASRSTAEQRRGAAGRAASPRHRRRLPGDPPRAPTAGPVPLAGATRRPSPLPPCPAAASAPGRRTGTRRGRRRARRSRTRGRRAGRRPRSAPGTCPAAGRSRAAPRRGRPAPPPRTPRRRPAGRRRGCRRRPRRRPPGSAGRRPRRGGPPAGRPPATARRAGTGRRGRACRPRRPRRRTARPGSRGGRPGAAAPAGCARWWPSPAAPPPPCPAPPPGCPGSHRSGWRSSVGSPCPRRRGAALCAAGSGERQRAGERAGERGGGSTGEAGGSGRGGKGALPQTPGGRWGGRRCPWRAVVPVRGGGRGDRCRTAESGGGGYTGRWPRLCRGRVCHRAAAASPRPGAERPPPLPPHPPHPPPGPSLPCPQRPSAAAPPALRGERWLWLTRTSRALSRAGGEAGSGVPLTPSFLHGRPCCASARPVCRSPRKRGLLVWFFYPLPPRCRWKIWLREVCRACRRGPGAGKVATGLRSYSWLWNSPAGAAAAGAEGCSHIQMRAARGQFTWKAKQSPQQTSNGTRPSLAPFLRAWAKQSLWGTENWGHLSRFPS